MTKKDLINRWKLSEGGEILKAVLVALKKRQHFGEIPGLKKFEDRWDLRGATLSVIKNERTIGDKDHKLIQKLGSLKLENVKFENVDLSYADISHGMFQECYFDNCLFMETKAREIHICSSDFNACIFSKTNFSYSFMNKNIGNNAGSFKNCKFLNANLKEAIFSFPVMDNCVLENCNLYATDFDGTRMRNVRFIGRVDSPWFRGYSTSAQQSVFWIFNKINPKDYPNRMENVDFSKANLAGVTFSNEIDLSNCILPDGDNYLLVSNMRTVYSEAVDVINNNWEIEDKRKALSLIENLYFNKDKQNQKFDLIDKSIMVDDNQSREFGEKFFNLIKEVNRDGK